MIPADEDFGGSWPWEARICDRSGHRQHYVDVGPRDAPPLVLLHGEPTWGYLWRRVLPALARDHRVVVPDHLGFGKSADPAPEAFSYLGTDHAEVLDALLVDELDLRGVALVLHDWGGPIGTGWALRRPERVRAVVGIDTVLPLGLPGQAEHLVANASSSDWFRWAAAGARDGTLEAVLGHAGSTVTHAMRALQGVRRPEALDDQAVAAYAAHFRDRAACEGVLRFPLQIVAPDLVPGAGQPPPVSDPSAVAALRGLPALFVTGAHDRALLPEHTVPAFRAGWPDAPVVVLDGSGHFPQEDQPEALVALLRLFLGSALSR